MKNLEYYLNLPYEIVVKKLSAQEAILLALEKG